VLFDETDRVASKGKTERPEPDRDIAFKGQHGWTHCNWRTKDDHPAPRKANHASKSIHWLF
jgi:hypothetical protein